MKRGKKYAAVCCPKTTKWEHFGSFFLLFFLKLLLHKVTSFQIKLCISLFKFFIPSCRNSIIKFQRYMKNTEVYTREYTFSYIREPKPGDYVAQQYLAKQNLEATCPDSQSSIRLLNPVYLSKLYTYNLRNWNKSLYHPNELLSLTFSYLVPSSFFSKPDYLPYIYIIQPYPHQLF